MTRDWRLPAFLFVLLYLLAFSGRNASAQRPDKLRLLVIHCINRTPFANPDLNGMAVDVIYSELARTGNDKFDLIGKQEIEAAATRLGLPFPEYTAPSHY